MLVTNHCKGIVRLLKGKIELLPGDNTIPDEDWHAVKGNRHVTQLIALKRLSVAADGGTPTAKPSAPQQSNVGNNDLSSANVDNDTAAQAMTTDMNAKDAIKLVKESSDEAWLQACLTKEARSTVTDAIYARMDELDILPED